MNRRWLWGGPLLGLAAAFAGAVLNREAGAEPSGASPEPELARSFAVETEKELVICLVSKDWALAAAFDNKDFHCLAAALPPERTSEASRATLYVGPDVGGYIKPPAGPPSLPIPTNGRFGVFPIKDLTATLVAKEQGGVRHVRVKLPNFKAGDTGSAEFLLPLRVPCP